MAIVRTGVSSAMTSSTATVSIPLPTGCAAGDVGILCIETANEGLGTNPGALGWTVLTGSTATATGTAAAAGGIRLAVLWKVLTSGDITTGSVSISDSGDHQNAVMATYSGVDTTTPITWNSGLGDVGTPATTSVSLASVTRGSASSVTLGIIATDRDSATVSTNTSPSWTGVGAPASNSFIANFSSITGQGGGLILNEGTGGASGAAAFSCSITSSIWVGRVIVLNPASPDVTVALTGQAVSAAQTSIVGNSAFSLTGQANAAAQGSLGVTRAPALTGQSVTAAVTSLAPASSVPATGLSLTAARGSVAVGTTDVTVALSGQSLSIARGSVGPATSKAMTGQAAAVARGSLLPSALLALLGLSATASRGTVAVSSPDVTVALTGVSTLVARGSLAASVETVTTPHVTPNLNRIGTAYPFDARIFDSLIFDCPPALVRPTLGGWVDATPGNADWAPNDLARGTQWAKATRRTAAWAPNDQSRGTQWNAPTATDTTTATFDGSVFDSNFDSLVTIVRRATKGTSTW